LTDTFKAHNNGISNQSLLETAQNPARFFQKNTLAHSVKAVPGYMRKKGSVKSEKKTLRPLTWLFKQRGHVLITAD